MAEADKKAERFGKTAQGKGKGREAKGAHASGKEDAIEASRCGPGYTDPGILFILHTKRRWGQY